eukprot:TRINITY_DN25297_c0_g1_i1.p1 TRINITY_DN25297_c0_g1~~TRINITY_DN25297_c0_g1_i1.p1  ORF type:complete len:400 (+),score=76.39 TRINITY_DN25297_c0_g1_i1:62-1201(+)
MAILGVLPNCSIMVGAAAMTAWIIGGGFYFLPALVFHKTPLPSGVVWALSISISLQVLIAFGQGLTVGSYYTGEPVSEEAAASSSAADTAVPGCHAAKCDRSCDRSQSATAPATGTRRICKKCKATKPADVHHCSTCRRCVVGMDHHCQFLNTCIGSANMRHFLRYVGWVCIACAWVSVLTGYAVYDEGLNMELDFAAILEENSALAPKVGAFVLAFPFSLVPAAMPFVGLGSAAALAVAVTIHFAGAAVAYFTGGVEYYVACLLVSACVASSALKLFAVLSLGLPAVLVLAVALFFTISDLTFRLVLLLLSAVLVAFLTFILFDSNVARIRRGLTSIDVLQGKPEILGREDEFLASALGCATDAPRWHMYWNFFFVPM